MSRKCPTCLDRYDTSINSDHEQMHIEGTKEWQRNEVFYYRKAGLNWRDIAKEMNISSSRVKRLFNDIANREQINWRGV